MKTQKRGRNITVSSSFLFDPIRDIIFPKLWTVIKQKKNCTNDIDFVFKLDIPTIIT